MRRELKEALDLITEGYQRIAVLIKEQSEDEEEFEEINGRRLRLAKEKEKACQISNAVKPEEIPNAVKTEEVSSVC